MRNPPGQQFSSRRQAHSGNGWLHCQTPTVSYLPIYQAAQAKVPKPAYQGTAPWRSVGAWSRCCSFGTWILWSGYMSKYFFGAIHGTCGR